MRRHPLQPFEPTQRIANVRWSGTQLSDILRDCGPAPEAQYLWSYGADYGEFGAPGVTSGEWHMFHYPALTPATPGTRPFVKTLVYCTFEQYISCTCSAAYVRNHLPPPWEGMEGHPCKTCG